jgi:ADP-ribose pyrophosphatase
MIKTLEERIVYQNDFVVIRDNTVEFPSGKRGTYYYSQWKSPHGVAVIVLYKGAILLLKNYRYSEQAYSYEIPLGFGTDGSSPEEDAKRELQEEIGVSPNALKPLTGFGKLYRTHLFLWEAETLPELVHSGQEMSEAISDHLFLPLDSVSFAKLNKLGVHDPVSVAAILTALALTNNNLLFE